MLSARILELLWAFETDSAVEADDFGGVHVEEGRDSNAVLGSPFCCAAAAEVPRYAVRISGRISVVLNGVYICYPFVIFFFEV